MSQPAGHMNGGNGGNGGRRGGDPSSNVLDLVDAANKRQDDLRESESRHLREVIAIRSQHAVEMRTAEKERLDAIRLVDVGQVQRAAEVQQTAAAALAEQVRTSAETLRATVAAAATAAATALAATVAPLIEAIADLRKAQYEQQGQKSQVVEGRATNANRGIWIAIAVSIGGILSAAFLATAAIVVTFILRSSGTGP